MQGSFPGSAPSIEFNSNPVFNVVLAYEDFETGKHAKQTYDFLVENLGSEFRFTNQMWKFDVLSIPKLREIAAKDALMADIIIISCRGGADLPNHVKSWIANWTERKGNAIGLVALFYCPPDESRSIRQYLSEAAKKAKMEFFAQPNDWSGTECKNPVLPFHRGSPPGLRAFSTLTGVVNREFISPRWGLNE